MVFRVNPMRAFDRQYLFSLLVVSALCAKIFHLWTHITSLPIIVYLLYIPTFLIQDYFVIILGRLLLHSRRGKVFVIFGGLISFLTLFASAASFAFYLETGGEIHWNMTRRVGKNIDGFAKLILSASTAFVVSCVIICALAAFVTPWLYNKVGIWLATAWNLLVPHRLRISNCHNGTETIELRSTSSSYLGDHDSSIDDDEESKFDFESESDVSEDEIRLLKHQLQNRTSRFNLRLWISRVKLLFPIGTIIVLRIVRPQAPYGHMSNTLPFTLLDVFAPERSDLCQAGGDRAIFPFPQLINSTFWETPSKDGFSTGWMPGIDEESLWKLDNGTVPEWLPKDNSIKGFDKWYSRTAPKPKTEDSDFEKESKLDESSSSSPAKKPESPNNNNKQMAYNPVTDPLRISNMDSEVLPELVKAFSNKENPVNIKHVILLSLESTRKDVFPLKNDSHLMEMILESHKDTNKEYDDAQLKRLRELTKTAELLTGEGSEHQSMGGLNIIGATTGATFTLKSLLGSHCGVSPLAVDFLEEVESPIYQPCFPQILKLLNNNKTSTAEDWKSREWESVFLQSTTTKFDRQREVLQHMGFTRKITKENLEAPNAPHKLTEPESNYFGYPESTLKPYLKDILVNAEKKNKRMFISHLTSSTHHPWSNPESYGPPKKYMGGWKHEAMNNYINTVGYCDDWLGQILELLEETGLRNETLIVAVGDHGMAFVEDDKKYTTYENGHITNFRVPLVFHHPQIPRLQLQIPATSMSILPTVLDLLVNTNSLNEQDSSIARHLSHEYEGQSLIRPYAPTKNGRQQWNFGVIAPGGTHLSVASATSQYRLVMPVCEASPYRITDLKQDPNEKEPLEVWGLKETLAAVKKRWGEEAESFVRDAEAAGGWWIQEGRRRWDYTGASRKDDRSAAHNEDGRFVKDHWWET